MTKNIANHVANYVTKIDDDTWSWTLIKFFPRSDAQLLTLVSSHGCIKSTQIWLRNVYDNIVYAMGD